MPMVDERAGLSGKYFLSEKTFDESIEYSERGFAQYGGFTDMYGNLVRVVESSRVDGGVWVFCTNDKDIKDPSPHLNADQIDQLIDLLAKARDHIYGVVTEDPA